jgi:hypothetical protein
MLATASAVEPGAGPQAQPAETVKMDNPDIELVLGLNTDYMVANPFNIDEQPYVFRKGETIGLRVSLSNEESADAVPLMKDGRPWYQFVDFQVNISDPSGKALSTGAALAVAKLVPRFGSKTPRLLPAGQIDSGTWELLLPDSLTTVQPAAMPLIKVTVDCNLRADALGMRIGKGSGKTVGSVSFLYKRQATARDEAVARYRNATQMILNGEAEAGLAIISELARQYPDNVEFAAMTAKALKQMGQTKKAAQAYRDCAALMRRTNPSRYQERIVEIEAAAQRLMQQEAK